MPTESLARRLIDEAVGEGLRFRLDDDGVRIRGSQPPSSALAAQLRTHRDGVRAELAALLVQHTFPGTYESDEAELEAWCTANRQGRPLPTMTAAADQRARTLIA